VVFQKPQKGDIKFSHASISKINQNLAFFPEYAITEGIKSLIKS
jgi:nucleoside-diphosphate-sugar epimerase